MTSIPPNQWGRRSLYRVRFENKWGAMPGTIAPFTIEVFATSYGEALERAGREYIESNFRITVDEVIERSAGGR